MFDKKEWVNDESYVSPGSIGGKIKKYRELREMSQKQLGIKCGYSTTTADVRIAQYEKNKKLPREKALKTITTALDVDECAIFDADLSDFDRMCHALFDLEDFHSLSPVKKEDGYYLEFNLMNEQGFPRQDFFEYRLFMEHWYEMREKCKPNFNDTEEEKSAKQRSYDIWRAEYPNNVLQEQIERQQDLEKMRKLQVEMDALNAKMKSADVLAQIDASIDNTYAGIRAQCEPIKSESAFIYLLKDLLESGLNIEMISPDYRYAEEKQSSHLLSIKVDEILNDENSKGLFAKLVYAIESLQQAGIEITRVVTSKDNVLYLTYKYPRSQYECFARLNENWKSIMKIVELQNTITSWEIKEMEEDLRNRITGENDFSYELLKTNMN